MQEQEVISSNIHHADARALTSLHADDKAAKSSNTLIFNRPPRLGRSRCCKEPRNDIRTPHLDQLAKDVARLHTASATGAGREGQRTLRSVHLRPDRHDLKSSEVWLGNGRWDVIHFNFGIHDRKYADYGLPATAHAHRRADEEDRRETDLGQHDAPIPMTCRKKQTAASIVERHQPAAELIKTPGLTIIDLFTAITRHCPRCRIPLMSTSTSRATNSSARPSPKR